MDNKVEFNNKKRTELKSAFIALLALSVFFFVMMIFALLSTLTEYDGDVLRVNGKVADVFQDGEDESIDVMRLESGEEYNITIMNYSEIDFKQFVGKDVTVITPANYKGKARAKGIGFEYNGETLVDYKVTSERQKNDLAIVASVVGAIGLMCIVTSLVFFFKMRKTDKIIKVEMADALVELLHQRQPSCKEVRRNKTIAVVWILAMTALIIAMIICGALEHEPSLIATIVLLLVVFVGGMIFVFAYMHYSFKKDREFYTQNFPFDFTDISHAPLRKKIKEQIQKENIEDRLRYPDIFPDCGNGLDAEFTDDGVILRDTGSYLDDFIASKSVGGVFDEMDYEIEGKGNYLVKFSYSQANFVAVPVYRRKECPLFIVIKSRLEDRQGAVQYDMHFAYDVNLQRTLDKFNVEVEGLEYILEHKGELMAKNCPKAKQDYIFPMMTNR